MDWKCSFALLFVLVGLACGTGYNQMPNTDPCKGRRCGMGKTCIVVTRPCVNPPCPEEPECVPENPCILMLCPAMTRCENQNGRGVCVKLDLCELPAVTGMCRAYIPSFFFNSDTGLCEDFIYGGCGGNDNRFETKDECEDRCGTPCDTVKCGYGQICVLKDVQCPKAPCPPIAVCENPQCPDVSGQIGICVEECDAAKDDCAVGKICCSNGCGHTCIVNPQCPDTTGLLGTCVEECGKTNPCPDGQVCCSNGCGHTCSPVDPCEGFECGSDEYCDLQKIVCITTPCDPIPICRGKVCTLPVKVGPCEALIKRYYYDPTYEVCREFNYGGCDQNGNNFETLEDCRKMCRADPDPCHKCRLDQECIVDFPICKKAPCSPKVICQDNPKCPSTSGSIGICVEECGKEAPCQPGEICCPNGCGHTCVRDPDTNCPAGTLPHPSAPHCGRGGKRCPDGYYCEIHPTDRYAVCCTEPEDPCNLVDCQDGYVCVLQKVECPSPPCEPIAVCVNPLCPDTTGMIGICVDLCGPAKPCPIGQICCSNGCGHTCIPDPSHPCSTIECGPDEFCDLECDTFPCVPVPVCRGKVCKLPMDQGPCDALMKRFYYDPNSRVCREFLYGGCKGNGNNFMTEEDCRKLCRVDDPCDVCEEDDECELEFVICVRSPCPPLVTCIDTCEQPKVPGPCRGSFQRYWFNAATGLCEDFTYGGCQGNTNNFETIEACEERCDGTVDVCKLPKDIGPCEALIPRFYYEESTDLCRSFEYGGCDGNANNYKTLDECMKRCGGKDPCEICKPDEVCETTDVVCVKPPCPPDVQCIPTDICSLPSDQGPCKAAFKRWYYNSATEKCEKFIYGGCQGNANNFMTKKICEENCNSNVLVCHCTMEGDPQGFGFSGDLTLITDVQMTLMSKGMNPDKYDRCKYQARVTTDDGFPGKEGQVYMNAGIFSFGVHPNDGNQFETSVYISGDTVRRVGPQFDDEEDIEDFPWAYTTAQGVNVLLEKDNNKLVLTSPDCPWRFKFVRGGFDSKCYISVGARYRPLNNNGQEMDGLCGDCDGKKKSKTCKPHKDVSRRDARLRMISKSCAVEK